MKAIIKVLVVLCWLPLISTAQTDPFSDIVDSLSPAAKATKYELVVPKEPKFKKGWYVGGEIAIVRSRTNYYIPEDPITKLGAVRDFLSTNSTERIITTNVRLNFDYKASEVFTISFSNINMINYGQFSLYKNNSDTPYSTNYLKHYLT